MTEAKPEIAARKAPRQARSRQTVEAILEGAARILRRGGTLTTNHVASEAGVSVGSLYQYFPNAPAIVAALIERHVAEEVEGAAAVLAEAGRAEPNTVIERLVARFVAAHTKDPTLTRALHAIAPSFGLAADLAATRDAQAGAIADALGFDRCRTRLVVAAIEGALLAELARGDDADLVRAETTLNAIAHGGLYPDERKQA